MPEAANGSWARMLAEAGGLSAACFLITLLLGGSGPSEAAVAAVAVAGAPNPSGSRPLHTELGHLAAALAHSLRRFARQDSTRSRRTAA